MLCEYAIVTCPKTGMACTHRNCAEACEMSKHAGVRHATFGDCIRIYSEHADVTESRRSSVVNSVRNSLSLIGFDDATHVDAMSYRRFRELIVELEKPKPDGTKLERSSVSKRLSDIRAICGTGLRDWFEDEGFSRPVFDVPIYKVVRRKVKVMTQEQDCKVENWMRRLSCSADPIERRMFVALWFERLFGMRPGDINRLTWDCIHIDGPIVRLVYKPNKTKKCPGRDDPIIVPMKIWSYVAPFYVPGGLLLPRLRKARSADSRNRAIWSRINRQYREWGICDDVSHGKASYINRRQRITEAFEKDGIRGASAIGKKTPKVQMEHYVCIGEYAA